VVTVLLRVPAFLASNHLTFDDGVFGASAVAMRHGGRPFAEVFSSQGPLFLPLIWLGDLAGFRTANAPRVLAITSAVVLAVATYAVGRLVADRAGALLAAGLVTTSIGLLGVTGPLHADGPALAAAVGSVAVALAWRRSPSVVHAVVIGLVVAVALSVKVLVVPAVLAVALLLLAWRRPALVVVAAGTSVVAHVLVGLPWGWGDVWDQSYGYHLRAAGDRTPLANIGKTASTLGDRELPLVVALALAVAFLWAARRRAVEPRTDRPLLDRWTTPDALLLVWVAGVVAVLLVSEPMWRPHVAHLVPPLALLVARHRPPWKALAVAAVAVVPYHVVHAWFLLDPAEYLPSTERSVAILRDLPAGALAISDDPGVVWRAGRRTTDDLVDASILRIETGDLDARDVAAAAAGDDVCAVVVRSAVRWGSFVELPELLAEAGYEVAQRDGPVRTVYVKTACRP
jgi:hypothetical protein